MATTRDDAYEGYEIPCKDYHNKNIILEIRFVDCYFLFGSEYGDSRWITYCTIHPKGSAKYYFGGAVHNPHDKYDKKTGEIVAYKRALRQRWEEVYKNRSECHWKRYSSQFRFLLYMTREHNENGKVFDSF